MDFTACAFAGLEGPIIGRSVDLNHDNAIVVFPIVALSCLASAAIALFIKR